MFIRIIKKAAGWFAGFGIFFVVLAFAFSFALRTDRLETAIGTYVNQAIPGAVLYKEIDLSLFTGTAVAKDFQLVDPEGRTLISVNQLYLNLSWFSLFRNTIHLDEVMLDGLVVYLETDGKGDLNLLRAFPSVTDTPPDDTDAAFELPVNVTFGEFTLNRGTVRYRDYEDPPGEYEEIMTRNISIQSMKGNVNRRSGHGYLELGPCDIKLDDMKSHVKQLVIETALKKDVLSPFTLHLDSDMGICDLKGSISDLWTGPRYDLDVTLDASLEGIDRVFDVECELVGRVTGGGKVSGHWDDPEIKALLHCDGGKVLGSVVGDLDLDAKMRNRVIDIRRLAVKAPGGDAVIKGFVYFDKAFEKGFFTSDFIEPEFAWDLYADQMWTRPDKVPGIPESVKGHVKSSLMFKGKGFFFESMVAQARISARADAFRFLDDQPGSTYQLITTATMDHSKLTVKRFNLEGVKNSLNLKGNYRTDNDVWSADLDFRSTDLSQFPVIRPYGDFAGQLNFETSLKGTLDTVSGRVKTWGDKLIWDDIILGAVSVDGYLKPTGVFSVAQATLKHQNTEIEGAGDIGIFDGRNKMDILLSFRDVDAGYVVDEDELKGLCSGNLALRGDVLKPVGDLQLSVRDLAWQTYALGSLATDLHYAEGLVSFRDLKLINKRSTVEARGTVLVLDSRTDSLLDDPVCDMAVTSKELHLEDFYPPVKGTVSVDTRFKGPLTRSLGHFELEGREFDLGGQKLDTLKASLILAEENILVTNITAGLGSEETVTARGRVSLVNKDYDLTLKTRGLSMKNIDVLSSQDVFDGKITGDVKGKGSFSNPGFSGNVSLSDVSVNNQPLDDADLDVDLKDNVLTLTGRAMVDLDARMRVDTFDFSAKALFDHTDLEPFFRMGGLEDLGGEVSGVLNVQGNLDRLQEIKGKAELADLFVKYKTTPLVKNDYLVLNLENKRMHLPETRLVMLENGYLVIGGEGTKDGVLDFRMNGSVPLRVIELFSDDLDGFTGDLDLKASVGGTFDKPVVLADLGIRAAGFVIPELMQTVHDMNGRIRLTSGNISIEELKGNLDSGRFSVAGDMALEDFKPTYLSLVMTGEALPISVPDMLDLKLNSRITVKGTPDDSLMEGDLVVLEGKYYKDVSLDLINVVKKNNRNQAPPSRGFTDPFLRSMGLNLSLTHKNPFEVDNNIAYLSLKPDLRVLGTLNMPRLSGRAEVEKGLISYQKKEFEVTKGLVDFINPYSIEPTLDVQCQTVIRDWIIYLQISGTPENMKFSLTSTPVLEDADILSLLVLGKTTDEIIEGNGEKTQSAAKLLAGIVSRNIEKNIKDATGIDTVKVEYTTTTTTDQDTTSTDGDEVVDNTENGVKVTLGKELSERLALEYGVETRGGLTIHQAESTYWFFENMMMKAFQNTENNYGAELVYRIEFR